MKTINTEVAAIILIGFLLTVTGIYLNFQNLEWSTEKFIDEGVLKNNEIVYGLVQVVGLAVIFVGATRGLLRRSDLMANKFVNIMDVFTSLIKKEMDVINDHEHKRRLAEIEQRSQTFKDEMSSLRRL